MKKYLPFILPVIALLVVGFLAFRWFSSRTTPEPVKPSPQLGEGVKIDNLSQDEFKKLSLKNANTKTVKMVGTGEVAGEIRYEKQSDQVLITVEANLPELKAGEAYQVWLQPAGGGEKRKAFTLTAQKGGFMGNASISASALPFEVVVTKETRSDNTPELEVLTGKVE